MFLFISPILMEIDFESIVDINKKKRNKWYFWIEFYAFSDLSKQRSGKYTLVVLSYNWYFLKWSVALPTKHHRGGDNQLFGKGYPRLTNCKVGQRDIMRMMRGEWMSRRLTPCSLHQTYTRFKINLVPHTPLT